MTTAKDVLLRHHSVILFIDCPLSLSFSFDLNYFTSGVKFKGFKLISPGNHLISYSVGNFKTGIFLTAVAGELLTYKWSVELEEFVLVPVVEVVPVVVPPVTSNVASNSSVASNACLVPLVTSNTSVATVGNPSANPSYPDLDKLDAGLGYFTTDTNWSTLTNHITAMNLSQIVPNRIISQATTSFYSNALQDVIISDLNLVKEMSSVSIAASASTSHALPVQTTISTNRPYKTTVDHLNFTEFNLKKSLPLFCPPELITTHSLDKSYLLSTFKISSVLPELQISFLLFHLVECWDGLEHWKGLVGLLCGCRSALNSECSFFVNAIKALKSQLTLFPKDFFIDPLSSGSFLQECLDSLYQNIQDCDRDELKTEMEALEWVVKDRFGLELNDLEEDAPFVVEI